MKLLNMQPHVTSSFLGPNILLSTLFSNTFNTRSFIGVKDQVSHTYKTTGRITVSVPLIFKCLETRWESK